MKKVCLIDSSYPINTRNLRIINSLKKKFDVYYIAWNRNNVNLNIDKFRPKIFNKKAAYGNKIKKLFKLFAYSKFIHASLKNETPDIVVASHWDILAITCFLKKRYKYNFKIVYENLDMPDHPNAFIRASLRLIEQICMKTTDYIVVASRFFKGFYKSHKLFIFENYTNLPETTKTYKLEKIKHIAFIGNVRHFELLKNLAISLKDNQRFQLSIYGDGICEQKFKNYCFDNDINNIKFNGSYDFDRIEEIYQKVDVVWSAYPSKSFNVKYAISNKFYEILAQNKIGIFSEDTELGKYVQEKNLGLVVDPYCKRSIQQALLSIEDDQLCCDIIKQINLYKSIVDLSWSKNEKKLLNFYGNIQL